MTTDADLAVVAIGGHSLLDPDRPPTVANQFDAARRAVGPIVDLVASGHRVVVTHGNGPQVGFMALRSELASGRLPEVPLDSLVADSQGAMGYMIERALRRELRRRSRDAAVVSIVTEVEVSLDDPAFAHPDKPIGAPHDPAEAEALAHAHGWTFIDQPGRGLRRVVPSPLPMRIVALDTITTLVDLGVIVICCGGGGIPVVADEVAGPYPDPVEAVIDKDRVSAMLAVHLGASALAITTSVDGVYEGYGTPRQRLRHRLTIADVHEMQVEGHFPPGSMGPKIEAAVTYLDAIDGRVVICLPDQLTAAMDGRAGTTISRHGAERSSP